MLTHTPPAPDTRKPWQLRMFAVSLKKRQKLDCLKGLLRPPVEGDCLLVTCGDNNGALNYHLRDCGGRWTFVDLEPQNIAEMNQLLGQEVGFAEPGNLPYGDASFDTVVTIDCHEHLEDPAPLDREIARVLRPGGRAIVTVPNGNTRKLATRLKHVLGMDTKRYGHVVAGYDTPQLEEMARAAGLEPRARSSYSRLFTELVELGINFAYMRVLSGGGARDGQIAPTSRDHLAKVEKSYKVYRLAFPFFWLFSQLDKLVPFGRGYAVALESSKP